MNLSTATTVLKGSSISTVATGMKDMAGVEETGRPGRKEGSGSNNSRSRRKRMVDGAAPDSAVLE